MEMKHEIIAKHGSGIRVTELVRHYERSISTICTILKQKDAIKNTKPSKGVTLLSKLRKQAAEKRETSTPAETFKASRGWLDNFKKRPGIRSVVEHGEAASSDAKAAADFVTAFASVFAQHGFIPQQVFNCVETGLFSTKMPRRTFITAEEKRLPGHKPMKDRLTLYLCANANGDNKIKPLLVYHSENTRAFKSQRFLMTNCK
ncbi:tigger transposable element-derived protein 1-like [Palaemon carinicauda]|uniref:tigger transposable element-derived protein 1-like n=1 Tax=Palaemon carinicauda TaxID=392227 RepID=UPI0035B67AF8